MTGFETVAALFGGLLMFGALISGLVHRSFLALTPVFVYSTIAIGGIIAAEATLSFLGIGLQPPIISWGVLLQEAQNIRAVAQAPWLLFTPAAAIVISVLSFNFLGDGLRDAADPYEAVS